MHVCLMYKSIKPKATIGSPKQWLSKVDLAGPTTSQAYRNVFNAVLG